MFHLKYISWIFVQEYQNPDKTIKEHQSSLKSRKKVDDILRNLSFLDSMVIINFTMGKFLHVSIFDVIQ